jgi:hypothetical protein
MALDRRRARNLLHWLLPLLVLRLLLPLGVMPGVAHGAPALVLCSLYSAASPHAGAPDVGGGSGPHDHAAQTSCPFAAAAHVAPVLAFEPVQFTFAAVLITADAKTGRALALIGPPRSHLSRAPPAFS